MERRDSQTNDKPNEVSAFKDEDKEPLLGSNHPDQEEIEETK